MEIGNSSQELRIKNNGKIYLQWGSKWIDVLDSEGNPNMKIKNLINSGTPTNSSNNGFYYDGDSVYLKIGNDIIDLSSTQLPEGSIIMYKGTQPPSDSGWYKYGDTDLDGVIYIINKSGDIQELAEVTLQWNPSTNPIYTTIGESFTSPVLNKIVSKNVPLIINYTSSDTSKATIDGNGNVTIKAVGQTTIVARTEANSQHKAANASYLLIIQEPATIQVESISISPNTFELESGDTQQFTAIVLPTNATNKTVTWSIVNGPATINQNGLLIARNVTQDSTVTIKATASNGISKTSTGTIKASSQPQPSDQLLYSVGLLSDPHFAFANSKIENNGQITTDGGGNSDSNLNSSIFFEQDLQKLMQDDFQGVKFISSPGDIANQNINDFILFTKKYKEYRTNNQPFYCSIGNHDHGLMYCYGNAYCQSGGNEIGSYSNGERWNQVTWNNTNFACPGSLATSISGVIKTSFGSKGSYFIECQGDIYIYLMLDYGAQRGTNDASQFHAHNQLDSNNSHVQYMMNKCGKTNIFNSPTESNFNFQYYNPYDLEYLGELLRLNPNKRLFIFLHHPLPHKSGGASKYSPGASANLFGLTFHYLNYLNNTYKNTIWFSGHTHFKWNDSFEEGIASTNVNYNYIEPNSSDNTKINENYTTANYFKCDRAVYTRGSGSNGTSAWNIHLPSMSRPVTQGTGSEGSLCEGAIMTVYSNKVEIKKLGYSYNGSSYSSYSINNNVLNINISQDTSNINIPNISDSGDTGNCNTEPEADRIKFVITNGTDKTALFTGKLVLYVNQSPNQTADTPKSGGTSEGVDFCYRSMTDDTSNSDYKDWRTNTEKLAPGESLVLSYKYSATPTLPRLNPIIIDQTATSTYIDSGNYYFAPNDSNGYASTYQEAINSSTPNPPVSNPAVKLQVGIHDVINNKEEAGYNCHVIFNSGQNLKVQKNKTYYLTIDRIFENWYNGTTLSYTTREYSPQNNSLSTDIVTVNYCNGGSTPTPDPTPTQPEEADFEGAGIWAATNVDYPIDGSYNDPTYGRLYTWEQAQMAATKYPGWRIPTEEEFKRLINTTMGDDDGNTYGENKSQQYWRANYNSTGKNGYELEDKNTNKIFFPASGRAIDGSNEQKNVYIYYWSQTEGTKENTKRIFQGREDYANTGNGQINYQYALRLIKNN